MPHADWLITGPEKVILPAQEIHLARSRNSSCPLVKTLYVEYCYCFVVTASALPETASIYG